jgi:hypothetical protein
MSYTTSDDKIKRDSLTDGGLEGLYTSAKELAVARGDHGRNFNAKNVGTTPNGAVDAINGSAPNSAGRFVGNDVMQQGFGIKQSLKVTAFTEAGLKYSTDVLKIDTTKYAPSGRR